MKGDLHVAALDVAGFVQALEKSVDKLRRLARRPAAEEADQRHRRAGALRRSRQGCDSSAETCKKVPSPHL